MAFEKEVQDFMAEGTELPESKLTTGFVAGERPPANWFNNLFYKMTQAVKELQTKSAEIEYVDSTIEEKITEFGENIGENLKDLPIKTITASEDNVIDFNTLTESGVYLIKNCTEGTVLNCYNTPSNTRTDYWLFVTELKDAKTNEDYSTYQYILDVGGYAFAKRYYTTSWKDWMPQRKWYTAKIPVTGWSSTAPYYVSMTISGIIGNDTPIVTPNYSSDLETNMAIKENWNKIDRIVTEIDKIKVYAFEEIPTVEIPISIQVIR